MNRRDLRILIPACAFLTGYILLSLQNTFFWDNILQGSRHALWFYRKGFDSLLLPDELDCGHIPFTGFYLALVWKVFGWSLYASHLAMLPWVLGIAIQLWLMVKKYLPENMQVAGFILVLADPTLFSQLGMASPDVILVFCFLLGVNAILNKNKILLSLALAGLVLSSLRGIMLTAGLFLFNFLLVTENWSPKKMLSQVLRLIPAWIPAGLLAAIYLGYHLYAKGWIGYQAGSPWADNYSRVSLLELGKNFLILGWRFVDFGRIFLWLAGIILLIRYFRPALFLQGSFRPFTLLWGSLFLVLGPYMILHRGLVNHRYLIPLFIIFTILLIMMLSHTTLSTAWKRGIAVILFLALLSGNLWRYPEGIATGWDSSMAHWPWYKIRKEVHEYILNKQIRPETVGTDFPDLGVFECIEPGTGTESFSGIDTLSNKYIFWSNIMNNFPDQTKQHLDLYWTKVEQWDRFGVQATLYQNPR
ncbi:MAG: hypothetical protein U0T82_00355 [Bacteroidales bacterium]